jgi:hypothetical protein
LHFEKYLILLKVTLTDGTDHVVNFKFKSFLSEATGQLIRMPPFIDLRGGVSF